jgi:hypothetical protein
MQYDPPSNWPEVEGEVDANVTGPTVDEINALGCDTAYAVASQCCCRRCAASCMCRSDGWQAAAPARNVLLVTVLLLTPPPSMFAVHCFHRLSKDSDALAVDASVVVVVVRR